MLPVSVRWGESLSSTAFVAPADLRIPDSCLLNFCMQIPSGHTETDAGSWTSASHVNASPAGFAVQRVTSICVVVYRLGSRNVGFVISLIYTDNLKSNVKYL